MSKDEQENKNEIFVARQPIFTTKQAIYGYELLFRSNRDNFFDQAINQDFASSKTLLDSFLLFGMQELTRQKRAFINLTKKNLLKDYVSAVPHGEIVVELLETIEPDEATVAICKKLKKNGYILALDDFIFEEKYAPLIEVADIIKVDFMATKGEERRKVIKDVAAPHIKFLAEKVETPEEFDQAVDAGYTYFQGYFFSKPVIVSRTDLPSYKLNLILLLKELLRPDLNLEKVERIMQRDVSLSYKLLRFINSAAFGFHTTIRSIKHAITLIGIAEFKKWMSVIVVSQIGSEKPDELMQQSIVRAKFCELIAEHLKMVKADAFLMGMFSLLDTMVGRPMKELLESLPLTAEIKNALLCVPNNYKCILDLILCYERTRWQHVLELSKKFGLPLDLIPRFYMEAVKWAGSI